MKSERSVSSSNRWKAPSRPVPHLSPSGRIRIALLINFVFLFIEIAGGLMSGSLALLADAGHMMTDVAALLLALFVDHLSRRPPTTRRTYGLLRAEVLGAFINAGTMFFIVAFILHEAWVRMGHDLVINAPLMLGVALLGLLANMASAIVLHGGKSQNVNVRGAYLHMMGDVLGSLAAIVAGGVIWLTGWIPIDLIVSLLVSLLIAVSTWRLFTETVNILMESAPDNIKYREVKEAMERLSQVQEVHDLHIWTLTTGVPVLTCHVVILREFDDPLCWESCRLALEDLLRSRFGIDHTTLQFERASCQRECGVG
ncbi:MAG TPA: cation diffusion facilitator family transporter [Thermoanaerobaculia bacterium]|nr:cation diffusion facilitator family transporter [Thermoanaerobaculia bacterium]HUM29183.1 cation diffusion facilitator family transporter [Thermoanaerobaculia bacterium]HXK67561.1 cation diffusion facilitator family transporter [Thermoanaerobaculia bacterium]